MKGKIIYNIMNTYNGHKPRLVAAINDIFNDDKYKENRNQILFALAQRDKEEIKDKLNIVINDYDDVEKYDADILMHVCNNADIEMIIIFTNPYYYIERNELFNELHNLVHKYGKMEFDGDFSFCGLEICDFNRLADFLALSLDSNDNIVVKERINNSVYSHSKDNIMIPNFELERMIDYIERTRKERT
jgi:hypothetical protein